MRIRGFNFPMAPADDPSHPGGGGGGGDDVVKLSELTEDHPAIQAIVMGLKTKNSELLKKQKELKDTVSKFEGVDPEKARQALAKLQEIEEKHLLDEGKVDELLAQRTERMRVSFETEKGAMSQALTEKDRTISQLQEKVRGFILSNAIAGAATAAKVKPTAIELIRNMARDVWQFGDNDEFQAYQGNTPIMGKDAKPIAMKEWVEGLRQNHPYLFEDSYGGGAGRGNGSGQAGNLQRSKMTVEEKSAYITEHGQTAFQRLPA